MTRLIFVVAKGETQLSGWFYLVFMILVRSGVFSFVLVAFSYVLCVLVFFGLFWCFADLRSLFDYIL